MKRRKFLYATSISLMGASLVSLRELASGPKNSERMPVLFVGHGNPMNAIEKNKYSLAWEQMEDVGILEPQVVGVKQAISVWHPFRKKWESPPPGKVGTTPKYISYLF